MRRISGGWRRYRTIGAMMILVAIAAGPMAHLHQLRRERAAREADLTEVRSIYTANLALSARPQAVHVSLEAIERANKQAADEMERNARQPAPPPSSAPFLGSPESAFHPLGVWPRTRNDPAFHHLGVWSRSTDGNPFHPLGVWPARSAR